ncbi:hypothetical protein A2634_02450 [Candidatus Amesbacteria bacterium RIFCSPHIGHO2_01_FULL_48_32]|uniref:Peptidase M10 metallopeptidase domain-containing protein n=1 Tax=Candidatus Amesbacteria bacterium RIFCSPLOWO2_01_FULL_48_25 TaxID=1797259 RepID=A0A1F4ZDT9_9BACT|nr:MAG: hypothetical protein A2634_02450 [Candidatus Amesbacteria bacterium RIFCSPHIGHO2_01_FULL_48_32]OGD04442.1 MAG: hypothetical protein A2989_05445 [Candidatus Amesbacteria bacterium RIFCSPLOWO2_01_FULL_48_25]HJZ06289.1 matrixin family metalloprotease [Patescibacteria group bacterium]
MRKALGFLLAGLMMVPAVAAYGPDDLPEQAGDYPVPGRSDMRMRVFVYEPRAGRPGVVVDKSLACVDPDQNDLVAPAGWKLPVGNWRYKLNVGSVPSSVGGSNLGTIVKDSFGPWQSAISNQVNFVYDGETGVSRSALDWQNVITWGRTQGSALAVTYVRYYTATGLVADVDTVMNKKFTWSLSQCGLSNSYDAQNIMIHELGHWMGLDDEYTDNFLDNTMFGYGSRGETKKNTLEAGDENGVRAIY